MSNKTLKIIGTIATSLVEIAAIILTYKRKIAMR